MSRAGCRIHTLGNRNLEYAEKGKKSKTTDRACRGEGG